MYARWGTRARCSTAGARRTPRRATWAAAGGPNGPGPAGNGGETASARGRVWRRRRVRAPPPRRGGVILREDARLRAPVLSNAYTDADKREGIDVFLGAHPGTSAMRRHLEEDRESVGRASDATPSPPRRETKHDSTGTGTFLNWALLRGASSRAEIRDASDDDDDAELDGVREGERVWNAKGRASRSADDGWVSLRALSARVHANPVRLDGEKASRARKPPRVSRTRRASIRGPGLASAPRRAESRRKSRADDPTRARLFPPTRSPRRTRACAPARSPRAAVRTRRTTHTARWATTRGFTRPAGVVRNRRRRGVRRERGCRARRCVKVCRKSRRTYA